MGDDNKSAVRKTVHNPRLTSSTASIEATVGAADAAAAAGKPSHELAAGQAATARLIDMGKKLLDASREGLTDRVRQLVVDSGAPFTSDWLGTTALHLAAQNGYIEIAEILLKGGVNRDARTKLERTALHLAAQGGSLKVVDLLLVHGSDVNSRDMLKMTPLHWAVERGHVCAAERLLLAGADPHAKNKFQLTPIDIAQNSGSYEMIRLFRNWANKGSVAQLMSYTDLICQSGAIAAAANFNNNNNNNNKCNNNSHMSSRNSNNNSLNTINESLDVLDVNYQLDSGEYEDDVDVGSKSQLDIDEPYIDLVELEWNTLKFEPDLFLSNDEDDGEPKVEYLMKIVEELQKENRQLRQQVEQLSTTVSTSTTTTITTSTSSFS